MKKWNAPKTKRRLDRMFSQYILFRDKRICQKCGKTNCKVDCSHNIPRECLRLRWEEQNAITLCYFCHKRIWHHSPLVAVKWFEQKYGKEHCDNLIKISLEPYVFDEAEARRIEERLKPLAENL